MSFLSTLVPTIFSRISSSCWITMSFEKRDYSSCVKEQNNTRYLKAELSFFYLILLLLCNCYEKQENFFKIMAGIPKKQ